MLVAANIPCEAIFSGERCSYNDPGTPQNRVVFLLFLQSKTNASDGIAASSMALFCLNKFTASAFTTRPFSFAALGLRVAA